MKLSGNDGPLSLRDSGERIPRHPDRRRSANEWESRVTPQRLGVLCVCPSVSTPQPRSCLIRLITMIHWGRGNRVHRGKGVNLETDNSLGRSRLGEPSAFLQRRARLLFGDGEQTNMNLANLLV